MTQYSYVPVDMVNMELSGFYVPKNGLHLNIDSLALNAYVPNVLRRYVNGALSEGGLVVDSSIDSISLTNHKAEHASLGLGQLVTASTDPVTGSIDLSVLGASVGAKLGASAITYDTYGRVATHDSWTMNYDSSGRTSSQTNGTKTQTFNYDTSGRFTGITEA